MNIVFIIASLNGYGGTNRVATLLANNLSDYHEITILSRDGGDNTYNLSEKVSDIKFEGNSLSFLLQCKKYIENNSPDLVVIHTMSKLTPALLFLNINTKNLWSIEHISFDFYSYFFQFLRKFLYKKLDKIIVLTSDDFRKYIKFNANVFVVQNPSPLSIKNSTKEMTSNTILSIGRLTYQKGYDLLIQAWSFVEKKYPDWQLHIYGEGEDRDLLNTLISNLKLTNVKLLGHTDDVSHIYDSSEFYTMSSRFEGLPVVLIEAQSRGLPIISFDCPSGPAEIIHHNIDGLLIENGNVKKLAEGISYLIEYTNVRVEMSNNALSSAEFYQIDVVIKKWLKLIDSINI